MKKMGCYNSTPLKRSFVPETLLKDREKDITHIVLNIKLCALLKHLSVTSIIRVFYT